ncbi:MAG: capsule assembly Wzi family protein [Idiomarina sp.]
MKTFFVVTCICLSLLSSIRVAQASPWLEAHDPYLRQSLLTLANAGLVSVPVNTYPLPWKTIMADLAEINANNLPESLQFALSHVRHSLHQARHGAQTSIMVQGHSEELTLAGFGEQHHERAKVSLKRQFIGRNWAARLQVNHRNRPVDNSNPTSLDGSYAALLLGDWIVSIDALPLWWGPGQDSTLVMSTHARPIEKLQLSRYQSEPAASPVLSWLGPVSFTTFIGQLDPGRGDADNSLLWGTRITSRPLPALELGLSHSSQMNGSRVDRTDGDLVSIDDNHLLGFDFRYSLMNDYGNGAIYAEVANDTASNWLSDSAWLAGMEWHQGSADSMSTWYVEAADTEAKCSDSASRSGNCFYEHQDFFNGYRHHGQAIGSMFDTDTRAVTLGYRWFDNTGLGWHFKLRSIQFNMDNSQPDNGGHPFFDAATDRQQIDVGHRRGFMGGLLEVTLQSWRDRQLGDSWQDTEFGGYLRWEWRF